MDRSNQKLPKLIGFGRFQEVSVQFLIPIFGIGIRSVQFLITRLEPNQQYILVSQKTLIRSLWLSLPLTCQSFPSLSPHDSRSQLSPHDSLSRLSPFPSLSPRVSRLTPLTSPFPLTFPFLLASRFSPLASHLTSHTSCLSLSRHTSLDADDQMLFTLAVVCLFLSLAWR